LIHPLVAACDAVGYKDWSYTVVKGISPRTKLAHVDNRPVYLSANFWYARDYATNFGGETIHVALKLSETLLDRLAAAEAPSPQLKDEVGEIRRRMIAATAASFPIVYAVRVDPEWVDDPKDFERQHAGSLVITEVNISCVRPVPSSRILAKVEYVEGAESGYLGPQPSTWHEARRWGRSN